MAVKVQELLQRLADVLFISKDSPIRSALELLKDGAVLRVRAPGGSITGQKVDGDIAIVAPESVEPLFEIIRRLVAGEKYVIGLHASERLEERGIMEWQVVAGLPDAELIASRSDAKPNPAVEVRISLPDGTEFKAVWSLLRQSGVAKLVTVHFFDRG